MRHPTTCDIKKKNCMIVKTVALAGRCIKVNDNKTATTTIKNNI